MRQSTTSTNVNQNQNKEKDSSDYKEKDTNPSLLYSTDKDLAAYLLS